VGELEELELDYDLGQISEQEYEERQAELTALIAEDADEAMPQYAHLKFDVEGILREMEALDVDSSIGVISTAQYQRRTAELNALLIEAQDQFAASTSSQNTTAPVLRTPEQQYVEQRAFIQEKCVPYDVKEDYILEKELGSGGFGTVHVAKHKQTGAKVAVKVLNSTVSVINDKELVREIYVMLRCDHPNLVPLYSVYQSPGGRPALVMKLVAKPEARKGGNYEPDLMAYMLKRKDGLPMRDSAKIIYQIASAVHYLNTEHEVFHRDLKPDNVLIGEEGLDQIRVADYGHSRVFQGIAATEGKTMGKGTLGYSAPEMIRHEGMGDYDARVDVWSLGCIAYMCAVYAPAIPVNARTTVYEKRRRTLNGEYGPMVGPRWANVAPELINLIQRMLVVDPDQRITMQEILEDPWLKRNASP